MTVCSVASWLIINSPGYAQVLSPQIIRKRPAPFFYWCIHQGFRITDMTKSAALIRFAQNRSNLIFVH